MTQRPRAKAANPALRWLSALGLVLLTAAAARAGTAEARPEALGSAVVAHVESRLAGKELIVRWTTASESANAGFRIWGQDSRGRRSLLARVASEHPDSLLPRQYERRVPGASWRSIEIEEVSLFNERRLHGPFTVGASVGAPPRVADISYPGLDNLAGTASSLERALAWSWSGERSGEMVAQGGEGLLLLDRPGIYRLTYEQLLADGIDLGGVAPGRIAIVDQGAGVPRHVETVGATFGPGGFIEFVGRPQLTLSSPFDAYELRLDPSRAIAAGTLLAEQAPRGVVGAVAAWEDNRVYSYSAPGGDPWYDEGLLAWGAPATLTRTFDLPDLAAGTVELELAAWGYGNFAGSAPDHHLVVRLNGSEIASETFDGVTAWNATRDVTALVQPAGNLLEVQVPGDTGYPFDYVAFEAFQVHYPRVANAVEERFQGIAGLPGAFGIGGFSSGQLISIWYLGAGVALRGQQASVDGEVFAPGDGEVFAAAGSAILRPVVTAGLPTAQASSSAEYLIVTHPYFAESLAELVAVEESRGFATEVVTVDEIYAAYSDHVTSSDALASFLAASLANGQLQYVLLVGADTFDPYDHLGTGSVAFVPTAYLSYVQYVHFAPSDEALIDVDGDGVGEVPIGRLPARTLVEAEAAIAKVVTWAANEGSTPRAALLASGISDYGRYFAEINEGFAGAMSAWSVSFAAADDLGSAPTRQAVLSRLDAGIGLISYFGHSSVGQWDATPLLAWQDVDALANQGAPNLILGWGCWSAYFVSPVSESLAARLLLAADRGAAGTIGALSLTGEVYQQMLGQYFFQHAAAGAPTVGQALHAAKVSLRSEPGSDASLLGTVLLGDPAMGWPSADALVGGGSDGRD